MAIQPAIILPSFGSHTVSASPPGGTYNSAQSVTLESTEPAATIYFTTDGTDPATSSSVFSDPIEIGTNITLKFMAEDPSDNHLSSIVTEIYTIDLSPPSITSTEPEDDATRVDPRSIVNVTFSEQMDETTIDGDTFTILDDDAGDPISGTITYDAGTNTASFEPLPFEAGCVDCLVLGNPYTVTLSTDIQDVAGNPLSEDFVFSFLTGGAFTIVIGDEETGDPIPGAAIEIIPNPFTLSGSLTVEDNDENDLDTVLLGETVDGVITIFNVEFSSYTLVESTVPAGYSEIYENVIITVHDTARDFSVGISNLLSTTSISDIPPVSVARPFLTAEQFELYEDDAIVGIFSGIQGSDLSSPSPIIAVGPDVLPESRIATIDTIDEVDSLESVVFDTAAPAESTAEDLFDLFGIQTYPNPKEEIAGDIIYGVPAIVIPYEDSADNFVLTPIIGRVFPGMTLLMNQASYVDSQVAVVQSLNMTFAVEGNDVGFSFGITDEPPPDTEEFPLNVAALFLDVGFVGDVDFSEESAFASRPNIEILVNKTLEGFDELPDGCIDLELFIFDESEGEWEPVDNGRQPGIDTDTQCGYTLNPEHFSKFGVGGIKGSTTTTESDTGGSSGGGGRRTVYVNQQPEEPIVPEPPPESDSEENPLDRIEVSDTGFLNQDGEEISEASVGQTISIASTFTNHQQEQQDYSFIVLIIDEDGFAIDIAWQEGTVESGQTVDLSTSWMPQDGGIYTIKIFVWDGLDNPSPLSAGAVKNISVLS